MSIEWSRGRAGESSARETRCTVRFGGIARAVSALVLLVCVEGCGGSLAQPFDQMKTAPITAFRLQNFEPPVATASAPAAGGFTLPPQIQQLMTAGAALLPPGLLPPGLLPGAPALPPAAANTPRFHDFRIISYMNIADTKMHDETLDIFGNEKNFEVPKENCMYAEFGLSIGQVNQPPADILVSLSCEQVRTFGFVWPHGAKTGISADTAKRIVAVMKSTFGG